MQSRGQGAARGAEFGAVIERKFAQHRFALCRQPDANLPAVDFGAVTADQPGLGQAVDQAHHAVMPELQPLGQIAHGRLASRRFEGQKQLVLDGFQAGLPRRIFAKAQKAADLITKFGQSLVIGGA